MEEDELAEHVSSLPSSEASETDFALSFTKDCDRASVHTTISSMCRRLLEHTDVDVKTLFTYNDDEKVWENKAPDEFNPENEIIFGCRGKVPIESLKIQSNPRSRRSYANIISAQGEVNIDD